MSLAARVALAVLTLALSASAHAADPPSLDELARGVATADAALQSFEVNLTYAIRMEQDLQPGKYADLEAHDHVLIDRSGRFRYSDRGTGLTGETVHPWRAEAAWDGTTLRRMWGSSQWSSALISHNPRDASWRKDPRDFLFAFAGKPVVERLTEEHARVVGTQEFDGVVAVAVESRPVTVDGVDWQERLLIAPSKGFAVLRRSLLHRYPEGGGWLEYSHTDSLEHVEAAPGLWLPGRGLYESFRMKRAEAVQGKSAFPLSWRYELTFRDWQVNRPLDPAVFTLDFEPGLFVNDKRGPQSPPAVPAPAQP